MARRSRAYSFNNRTKKLFLSGTVVAETNESNVATVSGLLDSNTQSNITSVGTLTSVTATGNVETTSGFFLGNGSQLTGLSSTVKNYVDGEISGLVDSAPETLNTLNEIASALGDDPNLATTLTNTITTANTAMKGYVDAINSTLTSNAAVQAGQITEAFSAITEANTAVVGYVDGEITTVGSDITTANTAMKGYVDNAVTTANTAVVGYIDGEITTVESFVTASNTAMKGYVDGEIASVPPGYADSDVADYLPTYSGNVAADFVNANFFTGNGSQLTGLPAGYSDSDVDAHLSGGTGVTYSSGTISIGQAVGTGNSPTFAGGSFTGNVSITSTGNPTLILNNNDGVTGTYPGIQFDTTANQGVKLYYNEFDGELPAAGYGLVLDASPLNTQFPTTGRISLSVLGNIYTNGTALNSLYKVAVIGDSSQTGTIYGTASEAQYADLAEKYISDKDYAPGTVVVFGGGYEITESTQSHQRSVAGVISTLPAYLMNSDEDGLPVALQGRVPCKVKGPIDKGDLVVASDIPGVAQRLYDNEYKPGCVIGKALNSIEDEEIHSIEVVVGRV